MRTRKENKSKRISYADAYDLGSDNGEEIQDAAAKAAVRDGDGDFQEADHGSDDDEDDNDVADNELLAQDNGDDLMDTASDAASDYDDEADAVPRQPSRQKMKLLEKNAIHAIPEYPKDTRGTRVYDGPLRDYLRGLGLLKVMYGPNPDHVQVAWGMLRKWYNHHILPNRGPGEGGVIESPWLAEDYEGKQRAWCRSWYNRYRAAKGNAQRLRKIKPEHIAMFQPPMTELACFIGPFNRQQQLRTRYGLGHATLENGELWHAPEDSPEASVSTPKGWVLDTGGIPLAIAWAPLRGHTEQFLAVATIPFSDQEPKDADSVEPDPEERKKGTVQIWSLPLHREGGSEAHLVQSLSFDWGRPKRLQWCPVASPDDSKMGLLAILCADGQVRVLEISKASSGPASYGKLFP